MSSKKEEQREKFYEGMLVYMESISNKMYEIANELRTLNERLAERGRLR
jgi:hypothetical protein